MIHLPAITIGNQSVVLPMNDRDAISLLAILSNPNPLSLHEETLRLLITCPSFFLNLTGTIGNGPPANWNSLCDLFLSNRNDWVAKWITTDTSKKKLDYDSIASSTTIVLKTLRKVFKQQKTLPQAEILEVFAGFLCSSTTVGKKSARQWVSSNLSDFQFESCEPSIRIKKRKIEELSDAWYEPEIVEPEKLRAIVARLISTHQNGAEFEDRLLTEKLAAMKELAYGASHEINNPLGNIASRAQMMASNEPDPNRKRQLATMYQQAMRAHEMISDLMLFAHPPELNIQRFSLLSLLNRLIQELEPNSISDWNMPEDVELAADETQVGSMFKALFQNSMEANATKISVSVQCKEDTGKNVVEINVMDNGQGISEAASRHLFDPFFSGREAGRGLGFGLSKAWRIAELHGGCLQLVESNPGNTTFSITFVVLPVGASQRSQPDA